MRMTVSSQVRHLLCNMAFCLGWLTMAIMAMVVFSSCVHEWPEAAQTREVRLTVTHSLDWDYLEHMVNVRSRSIAADAGESPGTLSQDDETKAETRSMETARYIYRLYPKGNQKYMVAEYIRYSDDADRADFTTSLEIPVGDWDLHIWSDYVDDRTLESDFYVVDDFGNITLNSDYQGHNRRKEAFRGTVSVSVPETIDHELVVDAKVEMERPLASYAFVANDLKEFVILETTRWEMITKAEAEAERLAKAAAAAESPMTLGHDCVSLGTADLRDADGETKADDDTKAPIDAPVKIPDYSDYTVTMYYAGFLPSVFNHFTNKPIDSWTGQSYTATISELSETDALLGFDHVFVNGRESSVKVQMQVSDPRGNVIATSPPIDVPVMRGRCTVVKGEFLTSRTSGGVGINPDFFGDINIEIK